MTFRLWCFSILISYALSLDPKSPKLITEDGNLIIKPGVGRNVTLDLNGRNSYVNIGPYNVMNLLNMVNGFVGSFERYKTNIQELERTLPYISELFQNRSRLIGLMENFENNYKNFSNRRPKVYPRLPARLARLETRLGNLIRQLTINECISNPCKNGGTCIDGYRRVTCLCPKGWQGEDCTEDEDECEMFSGTDLGCQNGATCTNIPGSFRCTCTENFVGRHCTKTTLDCSSNSNEEICGHGTCGKTGTSVFCICDQGWTTDKKNIPCVVDVDECSQKQHPCSVNPLVPCINTLGSFTCGSCPAGYTGNGFYCTDIDECLDNNGGCSTAPKVQCINTIGSRICGPCPPGYSGDGKICTPSDLCLTNNGGCSPYSTCTSIPTISSTYVQCLCRDGFTGHGYGPQGCQPSQSPAFPVSPQKPVHCFPNPCVNGICHPTPEGYTCICHAHYMGTNCDVLKSPCNPQPCKNGGTCIPDLKTMGYRCQCTKSYTGFLCQEKISACGPTRTGREGTLEFPESNYTSYDHNVRCVWVLQTDDNKVLNVTFNRFHLEGEKPCKFDWLQIHDGRNSADNLIGRFCGTEKPKNIISTQNLLYMWFHSDSSRSAYGFSLNWTTIDPVCGGVFENVTFGGITSPGSPGVYPPNRDCYWKIITPPGKRIQIHFLTMHIKPQSNCSNDNLAIYDDINVAIGSLLARYCTNTTAPQPLLIPNNVGTIHFHSGTQKSNHYGFQLTFSVIEGIPGCGGLYSNDKGEITPPTMDDKYVMNIVCEYLIIQTKDSRIRLTFLEFDLEPSSTCRFDNVAVYDGDSTNSQLIGRYCGSSIPSPVISTTNKLLVVFKSDWSVSKKGFKMRYEIECHQYYTTNSGIIKSIGYPKTYPKERSCSFLIHLPPMKAITLYFIDFDIEGNSYPECSFDNLKIYDGENANATLIGTYCGPSEFKPPIIKSTHNLLYMQFNSDSSIAGTGFMANYTSYDLECGGILKEMSGIIEQPKAKKDIYDDDELNCTWVLSAPTGFIIQLTWMSFSLEQSTDCDEEYVKIYENNLVLNTIEPIGKYCGNNSPPAMTSVSNTLTIEYVLDENYGNDGFVVSYVFIDAKKVCGGTFLSSTGTVTSPGWPNPYPTSKDCTWIINVKEGSQIMLNFTHFDIENYRSCNADYLEIRSGDFSTAPLIGKYCGNTIPTLIPTLSNTVSLHFHSDVTMASKGFKLNWYITATECGGILDGYKGSIYSPNYPKPYARNAECYWQISTSAGSHIEVVFSDMELEEQRTCLFDYVEIFNSVNMETDRIGRYCKPSSNVILSSSNYLFVKFKSDSLHSYKGFVLNYFTVCTRTISGFGGVIESPNFPQNYPPNVNCTWTLVVPKGNKINITFSHFEIEKMDVLLLSSNYSTGRKTDSCIYEYVAVTDSLDDLSNTKKYLCGSTLPKSFTSKNNITYIHFRSDESVEKPGFRLEWRIFGCSGIFKRPSGDIETPGFTSKFLYDTQCDWTIRVEKGKSVQLKILSMEATSAGNCEEMTFYVYNGNDDKAQLLYTSCEIHVNNHTVTATGNYMFIRFNSGKGLGKRFKAKYSTIESKCGGAFVSEYGVITSQNYPLNYEPNSTCYWYITVPQYHRVNFTFTDYDLITNVNDKEKCADVINIYEGNTYLSKKSLIAQFCDISTMPNNSIISNTNRIIVEMSAKSLVVAKGFQAVYSMTCGIRINTSSEGIIQPDSNIWHKSEVIPCMWTIIGNEPASRVSVTITHLDLSENTTKTKNINCENEYLQIFNGESIEAPSIGKYCGNRIPSQIVSDGNAITLYLKPAKFFTGMFSAHYSVLETACGGDLTSESGAFASPKYPNSYPSNMDCVWKFKAAPGNKIEISFKSFDLVDSEDCAEDYLEIRRESGSGELIGVYCGNDIPSTQISENKLWVKFHSYNNNTANGFVADYSYVQEYEITNQGSGKIASPLFPLPYKRQGTFSWRIMAQFGNVIRISFEQFRIESLDPDGCSHYFAIYDGYDEKSNQLISQCGSSIPKPTESSTNIIFITLKTDNHRKGTIFSLNWESVDTNEIKRDNNLNTTCGSNGIKFFDQNVSIPLSSPGYPNGYSNNIKCTWTFQTISTNHLRLTFQSVSLEQSPGCIFDKITVYSANSHNSDWTKIKDYCEPNVTLEIIESKGDMMKIVFETDGATNRSGWSATIYSVCGNNIYKSSGEISYGMVPTGPRFVPMYILLARLNCTWRITVRPGQTIKVEFTAFNLTNSVNGKDEIDCSINILLRNGISNNSPLLGQGKYCGEIKPNDILETSSNHLFVKYTMPSIISVMSLKPKFALTFTEQSVDCTYQIMLTRTNNSAIISSPNYPNIPSPYIECTWIFTAANSQRIKIDFIERFDLSNKNNCGDESVEILDGGTEYSELISGKLCGNKNPPTYTTTGNMAFIRFRTNIDEPKNGFKARVSIDTCGGTIISPTGMLTSPKILEILTFDSDVDCIWNIITIDTRIFRITLKIDSNIQTEVNGNFTEDCNNTSLAIYDILPNTEEESIIDSPMCKTQVREIESASNHIIVKMKTKKDILKTAKFSFELSYNSTRQTCGGSMTTPEGYLNIPGSYFIMSSQRFCEWRIMVEEGKRITLKLLQGYNSTNKAIYMRFYNSWQYTSSIYVANYTDEIESSGNKMAVTYWTSRFSQFAPFKAHYTSNKPSLCMSSNLPKEGTISPSKNNLKLSIFCEYVYSIPEQYKSVVFKVSNMTINTNFTSMTCVFSSNRISFATSMTSMLRDLCTTYSGTQIIMSPFPETKIRILQNSNNQMNYSINYYPSECGGYITAVSDSLNLPIPTNSNGSVDCAWIVKFDRIFHTEISTSNVKLASTSCSDEYLRFRKMGYLHNFDVKILCGDQNRDLKYKVNDMLLIEYHANNYNNKTNLILNFNITSRGCGGALTYVKVFNTPKFPNGYDNNQECIWDIKTMTGFRVMLSFKDRFFLEKSTNCTKDSVEIFDTSNNKEQSLGKFCGREMPPNITSFSNNMKVVFRSDSSNTGDGFRAIWDRICGGKFIATTTPQRITSPGSASYSPNLNCKYIITADSKQRVNVKFIKFFLEGGNDCQYDNLTISNYDDDIPYANKQTFCDKNTPEPRKQENIYMWFKTDRFVQKPGFIIEYYISGCGGNVNTSQEISSSLDQTENECIWNITAPSEKIILIRFKTLKMDYDYDCSMTTLTAYDGLKIDSHNKLGTYCGDLNSSLPIIKSRTNHMILRYNSHYHSAFVYKAYIGFFKACDYSIFVNKTNPYNLKLTSGKLYESFLNCHWTIRAPRGEVVKITFKNFNVSQCVNRTETFGKNCACDYLEIRDGVSNHDQLIGRFCGNGIPREIVSSNNVAWIEFVSDGYLESSGIEATITSTPSTCGIVHLNATKTMQTLISPNDKNGNVLRGIRCSWKIIPEIMYEGIQIRVKTISLKDLKNGECQDDRFEINSLNIDVKHIDEKKVVNGKYTYHAFGDSFSTSLRYVYCGTVSPFDIFWRQGGLMITLDTNADTDKNYKGFALEYQVGGCSRNYTTNQGQLKIDQNTGKSKCINTITVESNRTISLYFQNVFFWPDDSTIEVRDGPNKSSKLLVKITGSAMPKPSPIFSTGNMLYIVSHIVTDSGMMKYEATFTSSDKGRGCGGEFFSDKGIIYSPLYPIPYRGPRCVWTIHTPHETYVTLKFKDFMLGPTGCENDYVELHDKDGNVITRYCSTDKPGTYYGNSNILMVVQHSSTNNSGTGWAVEFFSRTYLDERSNTDET